MMMFFAKERFGEIGHQCRNLVCDSNEDGDKDDHEYGGGVLCQGNGQRREASQD